MLRYCICRMPGGTRHVRHTQLITGSDTLWQSYDSARHRLDLERELDGRYPPGRFGDVTFDDSRAVVINTAGKKISKEAAAEAAAIAAAGGIKWRTKELPIGRALVSSHTLLNPECQCRHDLTVDGLPPSHLLLSFLRCPPPPLPLSLSACVCRAYCSWNFGQWHAFRQLSFDDAN
jgi:hypothetical protein